MLELILSFIFGIAAGSLVVRDLAIQNKAYVILLRFCLYVAVSTATICITSYFVQHVF